MSHHMWKCQSCHIETERQYKKTIEKDGKKYNLYFYKCSKCGQRVLAVYDKKLIRLTSFGSNTHRDNLKEFLKSIDCWEE